MKSINAFSQKNNVTRSERGSIVPQDMRIIFYVGQKVYKKVPAERGVTPLDAKGNPVIRRRKGVVTFVNDHLVVVEFKGKSVFGGKPYTWPESFTYFDFATDVITVTNN